MNDKNLITLLVALLATLFVVSIANAGTVDILKKAGDIQVLGVENALSGEPYEFARDGVVFDSAVGRTMLANADSNISLGDEIQELGIENALSAYPDEFIPVEMGTAMTAGNSEFCTDRLTASHDSIVSYGGEIQLFGIDEALLKTKC